ncbi:MAG: carbon-nitrogen hydrolase [Candidatus Schekmanbacteria bacterium]|nr:carbon-nitrogen hydrolase [Candidatus Schekmanbacteria bacterium]
MKKKIKIGLVQTKSGNDVAANLSKAIVKIKEAAGKGAKIICLQELFNTIYFPQEDKINAARFAEPIPGKITSTLSALAKKLKIVIIAPIYEKGANGKFYNSAAVIDADGKIIGTYRKIHIPHDPLFYEKTYFEPGNKGYGVFKTKYATVGVLICYDQWFTEAARITALQGAEIIFYPTAIGFIRGHNSADGDWHDAWETIQRGHSIANGVHVAAVNRVGTEGSLKFWGQSFISDSFGTVLKRGSATKEETIVVEVDLAKNKQIRDGWGFLKNRRPAMYKSIVKKITKKIK